MTAAAKKVAATAKRILTGFQVVKLKKSELKVVAVEL